MAPSLSIKILKKGGNIMVVIIKDYLEQLDETTKNFNVKLLEENEYQQYITLAEEMMPFIVSEKWIFRLFEKRTKQSTKYFIQPICTYCKVVACQQDIWTNERKYEVELFNGKEKQTIIFDSAILTTLGAQQLLRFGCVFDEKSLRFLLEFLSISAFNSPIKNVHSKLGWKDDNTFLSYKVYSPKQIESAYSGNIDIIPKGLLEKWLDMVKNEVIDNIPLFFGMLLGFSSVLLGFLNQHLDLGNLMFNYCGHSSKGKTTVAMLATSVFSKPIFNRGLLSTFNSTNNALLTFISQANSHTVAIDEIATSERTGFRKVLYQICSGAERMRLNTSGEMKESKSFNSIIISTAEFPIIDETAPEGLKTRVFEIEETLTTSAENSDNIKRVVLENYGVAGQAFLEFLFVNKLDALLTDYYECVEELKSFHINQKYEKHALTDRILSKLAVVLQTSKYFVECFGINCKTQDIIEYVVGFERSISTQLDISAKALEYIMQYVSRHRNRFVTGNEDIDFSAEGKISNKRNYKEIAILKEIVEDILENKGFENKKLIYSKWEDNNILDSEKDRKYKRLRLTKGGEIQPCFVFKIYE